MNDPQYLWCEDQLPGVPPCNGVIRLREQIVALKERLTAMRAAFATSSTDEEKRLRTENEEYKERIAALEKEAKEQYDLRGAQTLELRRENERLRERDEEIRVRAEKLADCESCIGAAKQQIAALEAALIEHRVDLHQYSGGPCSTCLKSAKALGIENMVPRSCAIAAHDRAALAGKTAALTLYYCEPCATPNKNDHTKKTKELREENERLRAAIRIAWTALTQQEPPAVAGIRRISETLEAALAGRKR